MKKIMLLMIGLLLAVGVSAYTCVNFNSGDPSVLLKKVNISYEIDWNHARVTNFDNVLFPQYLQKRGADYMRDWPEDRKKAEKYFTVRFNRKSDYMKISEGGGEYRMILRLSTIDVGNSAGTFTPFSSAKAGGVIMNGTIEFCDNSTGKVVCVLNIVEAKGSGSLSETVRMGLTLSEIAGDICDFVEDNVEDGKVQATPVSKSVATTASSAAGSSYAGSSAAPSRRTASVTTTARSRSAAGKSTSTATTKSSSTRKASADSPTGEARVVLKNGSVIIGRIKAFDPTKQITLAVGGITTTIPMSEVEKIETQDGDDVAAQEETPAEEVPASALGGTLGGRKLVIVDNRRLPASFTLKVGGQLVKMILVRGGRMNMGYDGDGSRKMYSEPEHEVVVTSFYISAQPLPASVVLGIVSDKNVDGKGSEVAQVRDFADAERVVSTIARQAGKPYRLPTEAEWEFAACSEVQNQIFGIASGENVAYEWCSDFLDYYPTEGVVMTDPTGPMSGEQHVVRSYNSERGKFDRSSDIDEDDAYLGLVRLAIKAKDYK